MKARLAAMQRHAPSEKQLDFLRQLGDQGPVPETMVDAAIRIEKLKGA
jgi:hypothetical protein